MLIARWRKDIPCIFRFKDECRSTWAVPQVKALWFAVLFTILIGTACDRPAAQSSQPSSPSATSAAVSPSTMAFGNQPARTPSSAQLVTLSNSGGTALTIANIGFTGTNAGDFSDSTTCGATLPAGQSCGIAIQFTPGASGTRAASLSISDNAGNSPQTIALSGTGTHDVILSWAASPTYGVVGYNVFRGTTSGGESPTPLNSSPVSGLTYIDSNVQAGETYYYFVTAVTGTSQSPSTGEASVTVPSP